MRYLLTVLAIVVCSQTHAAQGIPQIPQIPAFLPMAHTVAMGQSSPVDGEWMITTIGKRIRIQGGRAYALDPWVHMFVLQIKTMMVVISDITTTDGRNYVGKDLPLMGTWNAALDRDGTLNATVQTMVGPVRYALMPVRMDDQQAYDRARSGETVRPEPEESERRNDADDEAPDSEPEEDERNTDEDGDEDDWGEWD